MSSKRVRRVFLPFLLVFAACGVRAEKADETEITGPQAVLETRIISIHTASGTKVSIEAELARTARERQAGLMFRKELEDGKGMLFVFENDEVLSFWMKNTLIPLSIAFIRYDGTIVEIKDLYPRDLSPVHSSRSVRYALEAPRGWFDRAGVKAGDRIELDGLAAGAGLAGLAILDTRYNSYIKNIDKTPLCM
ncbi:MAG: DUF192 domain-containing protein [Treponema sp.]|jgi:uncharacterized membrane protein (UPF0127 family)|nr:DUF192 domain-containing protein [Treponema sp.]